MAENSGIQWTDNTFNPWIGCTKVSAECKFCYAEADMDTRRGRAKWGDHGTRSVTAYENWRKPLKWNRDAGATHTRTFVFCSSLADVFEDWNGPIVDAKGNELLFFPGMGFDADFVPSFARYTKEYVEKHHPDRAVLFDPLNMNIIRMSLFRIMENTPNLIWQVLTKRPENIMKMVPKHWVSDGFPPNVWIGTSCGTQEMVDLRLPFLMEVPALLFVSCEPLLEEITLNNFLYNRYQMGGARNMYKNLDWVIVGGESGRSPRFMSVDWASKVRAECEAAGVPFFMKQMSQHPAAYGESYKHWDSFPVDLQVRQRP